MKKPRFTDKQIVEALRDAEATNAAEAARKHSESEQSIRHHPRKEQRNDAESGPVRGGWT